MAEYVLCPRCELNYIRKGEEYCDVCKAQLKKGPQLIFAVDEDEEQENLELCPICHQNYIGIGEKMCSKCAEEMEYKATRAEEDDESWKEFLDEEEEEEEEDEEMRSLDKLAEEEGDLLYDEEEEEDEIVECVDNDDYDIPEIDELIKNTLKELYITETNEGLNFLFDRLKKIADKNDEENTDEILKAVLILVLNEFKSENIVHQTVPEVNSLVQKSVLYIAENIGDDLSISRISKHLNISESLLSHIFKDEMNISIHRYILKKRLITAFEKISSGCPATVAAAECGFSEYSNFYRQYKKAFGFPPSAKDYTLK